MTAYLPARRLDDDEAPELELLEAPTVMGQYRTYPDPAAAADRIHASGRDASTWGVYALDEVRPGGGGGPAAPLPGIAVTPDDEREAYARGYEAVVRDVVRAAPKVGGVGAYVARRRDDVAQAVLDLAQARGALAAAEAHEPAGDHR